MSQRRILIVEDDLDWQDIYQRCLRHKDYKITIARKVSTALILLEEQPFDVVITDLEMLKGKEEFSGFAVLEQAKAIDPEVQVIIITSYGSADHAMRAMSEGAYDYITKDHDLRKKLALTVQGALEARSLKRRLLMEEPHGELDLQSDRIIGNSASMLALFDKILESAESDANVLIYGEEGTGKRLIAQTIHCQSLRKDRPFLLVDCRHLSESVPSLGKGLSAKLERAQGGTVFLEGIDDLDMELQAHLLDTLHSRSVEREGEQEPTPADIRIIASTEKDLSKKLLDGQLHHQLFDEVNELFVSVPPLRDRKDGDDIPALAATFLQRHGKGRRVRFSSEAIMLLCCYNYPGNVGELENATKYALTMALGTVLFPQHLPPEIRNYDPQLQSQPKEDSLPEEEHIALQRRLTELKRNLIKLRARSAEFIDPRVVPLDFEESERLVRVEIARIEAQLAQLHTP